MLIQNINERTRVCGFAVRSGGELYVVTSCQEPIIAKYYKCDSDFHYALMVYVQDTKYTVSTPFNLTA